MHLPPTVNGHSPDTPKLTPSAFHTPYLPQFSYTVRAVSPTNTRLKTKDTVFLASSKGVYRGYPYFGCLLNKEMNDTISRDTTDVTGIPIVCATIPAGRVCNNVSGYHSLAEVSLLESLLLEPYIIPTDEIARNNNARCWHYT